MHIIFNYFANIFYHDTIYLFLSPNLVGFIVKDAPLIILASLLRKKIILTIHSGAYEDFVYAYSLIIRQVISSVLRKAHKIVVISRSLKSQFSFLHSPEKIIVIPNSCNSSFYDKIYNSRLSGSNSLFKQLGKSRRVSILYLSNFFTSKGYLDLIEAFIILNNRHKDVFQLRMFGKFLDFKPQCRHTHINNFPTHKVKSIKDLQSLILKMKLQDFITIGHPIIGREKDQEFRTADLFTLPSHYHIEGCPISIIEAMAYSLPIVATKWRAIPDLVSDNFNGYIVPIESPISIANAIEKVVFNDNYASISKNSRILFEQNHSFSNYYKAYKEVFINP